MSWEEGSLAYPRYPGRANVLSRFTSQNLANGLHEKQNVFSTRRETWGTYHLHGKTRNSVWKIKWLAPSVLPWVPEVFLACGGNFRCWPKANTSSAVGRSHERWVTIKPNLTETGNRVRKVSGTQGTSVWDASENMGCNLRGWHYMG